MLREHCGLLFVFLKDSDVFPTSYLSGLSKTSLTVMTGGKVQELL